MLRTGLTTVVLAILASSAAPQEVALPVPEGKVRIRVVDAKTGRPLKDASVFTARRVRRPHERWIDHERYVTGRDGTVDVGPVAEKDPGIQAGHWNYVHMDFIPLSPVEEAGVGPVMTIRLTPGFRIRGRVHLADGTPVTEGFVNVDLWGKDVRDTITEIGVRIGQDGAFEFPPLPPGEYRIKADVWVGGKEYRGERKVLAGDREVVLVLKEVPAGSLVGTMILRVRGPDGVRVSAGSYHVWSAHTVISGPLRDGEMKIRLAGGRDLLWIAVFKAKAGNGTPLGAAVLGPVTPGSGVRELGLPPSREVRGVVLTADGKPAAGLEVMAYPSLPKTRRPTGGPEAHAEAITDADGSFTLVGLGELEYEILARGQDAARGSGSAVLGVGSTSVSIRMGERPEAGATVKRTKLEIVVTNWPEGARAHARLAGPVSRSKSVGRDGRVVFGDLDSGLTYALFIGPVGEMMVCQETVRPGPEPLRVVLGKGGTIEGRILAPTGTRRLTVHTSWHDHRIDGEVGADGRFVFAGMPPGDWRIVANGYRGDRLLHGEVTAGTGETTFVEISFDPKDFRNLRLAPDADEAAVRAYIKTVLAVTSGRDTLSLRREKLKEIGPENAKLLLRAGDEGTAADRSLVDALTDLVTDEHRVLVIAELPRRKWLAKVVVAKGWARHARETLVLGMTSPSRDLLPEWVEAVAQLRDPETYGLLARYLIKGRKRSSIYEAIRDLPGIDLSDALEPAWRNAKADGMFEPARFAEIAAENGVMDALAYLVDQIDAEPGPFAVKNAADIVRRLTGVGGDAKEVRAWFEKHRKALVFDPKTVRYEVP